MVGVKKAEVDGIGEIRGKLYRCLFWISSTCLPYARNLHDELLAMH